jgi:MoaA/NifB/PqqE/SkfB family radical SAM enzyme
MTELPVPTAESNVLGLELTEKCNFACVHCYLERKIQPKFDLKLARMISDVAYDSGFPFVYLTGGEPTLHPEFEEIYRAFREKGYVVTVYTNAAILRESTFELFGTMAPTSIEVTLYGMSEETYGKMAQNKRGFRPALDNVVRLRQMGLGVALKYSLTTLTVDDFPAFLEFARETGCTADVNAQIIPMLNGDKSPLAYRLSPLQILEIGAKYGFDFTPKGDGFDACDAGRYLFIDSQARIRGCPVLHTDFDFTVDGDVAGAIKRIKELFVRFQEQRTRPLCPAWLELEGESQVVNFIDGLIPLPLAQ